MLVLSFFGLESPMVPYNMASTYQGQRQRKCWCLPFFTMKDAYRDFQQYQKYLFLKRGSLWMWGWGDKNTLHNQTGAFLGIQLPKEMDSFIIYSILHVRVHTPQINISPYFSVLIPSCLSTCILSERRIQSVRLLCIEHHLSNAVILRLFSKKKECSHSMSTVSPCNG